LFLSRNNYVSDSIFSGAIAQLSAGVGVESGFSGCISDIEIGQISPSDDLSRIVVDAANIKECSKDSKMKAEAGEEGAEEDSDYYRNKL
jgi:hypothetical protein